ncbi:MAG: hypothetical protein LBF61_06975, partial [Azoarcus sp.]|nr:hypothetical protein [Azoarcus sp.]
KTAAQERANIAEQRAARLERGYAVTDPRISRDLVITRAYCAGAEKTAAIKLDALLDGFRRAASSDAEDARAQIEQQWVTANAIAARALDALRRMQEESPIPLPERITGEHVMTPEEADRWHRDAQLIVNADAMERARIAAQVDGEEPKRRGRPRKTAE